MIFSLEALQAKHGDAFLLHFGSVAAPQLILIDGGPAGVYSKVIRPRLEGLKQLRNLDRLPIRLVMVSHIDDDHVNGILQLFRQEADSFTQSKPQSYKIAGLWHNSFDDILGNASVELAAAIGPSVQAAAAGSPIPANVPIHRSGAIILASVAQGRDLRNYAKQVGVIPNEGFNKLVMVPSGQSFRRVPFDDGLTLTVIGPDEDEIEALQEEWDKQIKKMSVARAAAFLDNSVFNLSSMIVVAEAGGKRVLLTGDARGDRILAAVRKAGYFMQGKCHFDLLKIPHHGSDRNVATEFFRELTADRYVFSGDGKYGNPEIATLQMLLEARRGEVFTMYFTNREPRLEAFFDTNRPDGVSVIYRDDSQESVWVDLAEEVKR